MTEMYETCSDIYAHRSRQEEPGQHVEELASQFQDVKPMHAPQPLESPRKTLASNIFKKVSLKMARDTSGGQDVKPMHALIAAEKAVLLS